jgi:hypothetical protein
MPRTLEIATLDEMGDWLASQWLRHSSVRSKTVEGLWVLGPEYVLQELYKHDYKDEHGHVLARIRSVLAGDRLADFENAWAQRAAPRTDKEHAEILAEKLAIDPDGNHIAGKVGRVQIAARYIGEQLVEVESAESIRYRRKHKLDKSHRVTRWKSVPYYWPIYAGETEERIAGSDAVDALPPGTPSPGIGALNFRISNEAAIFGLDAVVDRLDEGSSTAVIQGRTGAQPATVDNAVSGTLLFTCVMTDPAFGGAVDDDPGAIATAAAIADDTSADATNTLGYCRASATNDGSTPLDDHMDLEAGTSGADINFNTLSIVSGGTVSIASFTVRMPEGSGL